MSVYAVVPKLRMLCEFKYDPQVDILKRCSSPTCHSEWPLQPFPMRFSVAVFFYDPFQSLVEDTTPCWMR